MQYLSVPNFEKWQHYKDRTPPWIKLHRDLLRDYDFSHLPDATKGHLLLIWLLASQLDNRIPNDPAFIQRTIGSVSKPDIKLLIQKGFLSPVADCQQDASNTLASRTTLCPIRETETETEEETERSARVKLSDLSIDHVKEWLTEKRMQGKYIYHDEHFILEHFKNYCQSKGKTYADYIAAYRNAFEWDSCQPKTQQPRATKDDRARAAVIRGLSSVIPANP